MEPGEMGHSQTWVLTHQHVLHSHLFLRPHESCGKSLLDQGLEHTCGVSVIQEENKLLPANFIRVSHGGHMCSPRAREAVLSGLSPARTLVPLSRIQWSQAGTTV